MTRRVVMFDFDGTLADSMPALVDAMVDTFGTQLDSDERLRREQVMDLIQLPPRQMLQAFVDLTGVPRSRLQSMFEPVLARLPTRLFPEVPVVLASLRQSGYVLVISSTNPDDSFRDRLAGAGLTDQYDFALGTNIDAGITKEDHPRLAAERLGMLPGEFAETAVYVGDLPPDMELARKVGLLAIGRSAGANAHLLTAAGAQHVIVNLAELEPLLNRLAAA